MSMLAERRRKQKWSLNPRGKEWSEDANKFGQKMLEKMGWQHGKGLGAKEDGIVEHIKISYKNDSKGMGFKDTNDQWTQHESNFSALLESLTGESTNPDQIKVNSLEKKSQSSRARVHYHKFTRGKDLSRYSEKDLANIFGKRSLKEVKKVEEIKEQANNKSEVSEEKQSNFLFNAGSMKDYFKSKLPNFGKNNGYVVGNDGVLKKEDSDSESDMRPSFGFGYKSENTQLENSEVPSEKTTFISYISDVKRKACEDVTENNVFSPKKKIKKGKENKNSNGNSNAANIRDPIDDTFEDNSKLESNCVVTEAEIHRENSLLSSSHSGEGSSRKKKKMGASLDVITIEDSVNDINEEDCPSNVSNDKDLKKEQSPGKRSAKKLKKAKSLKENDVMETGPKIESVSMEFDNPNFNNDGDDSSNCLKFEDNPYEVKPKQKKSKKAPKADFDNPTFESVDEIEMNDVIIKENPYEVKLKKKNKKIQYENPSFDDNENPSLSSVISEENPYEVKVKKMKKNKKASDLKESVDSQEEVTFDTDVENNPYEVKVKDKKKKKKLKSLESEPVSSELENCVVNVTKKKKNKEKKVVNGITNPALNLNTTNDTDMDEIQDESDLMLNVVSTPVESKKSVLSTSGSIKKVNSVIKRRKSVRFNDVTQELVIPNNDDIRRMSSVDFNDDDEIGIDNEGFDKKKTKFEEKIDMISKNIESCQAEIENNINENKMKSVLRMEDIMVGEVGNPDGESEKLADGCAKLKFKDAHFDTKTPFYQVDKTGPKKSYKHLIKGDIVLKFKNSNLHEIDGYARKKKIH